MKTNWILADKYLLCIAEKYQQITEAADTSHTGGPQFDRKRHGGLYDRGHSDYYYGRVPNPHWWPMAPGNGKKITDLSPEEIAEYNAGYDDAEKDGDKKNWD